MSSLLNGAYKHAQQRYRSCVPCKFFVVLYTESEFEEVVRTVELDNEVLVPQEERQEMWLHQNDNGSYSVH